MAQERPKKISIAWTPFLDYSKEEAEKLVLCGVELGWRDPDLKGYHTAVITNSDIIDAIYKKDKPEDFTVYEIRDWFNKALEDYKPPVIAARRTEMTDDERRDPCFDL